MKALTTAIYALFSTSTLASLIGGRLYKGQAPEGAEFPYATYGVISIVPERTFCEHYENVMVQFDLFSITSSSSEVEDLYSALDALYDECSLSITGSTLVWMRRVNAILMIEDNTTPAGTQKVWAYHVDFEVFTSLN